MKNEPVRLDDGEIEIITLSRGDTLDVKNASPASNGVDIVENETHLDILIGGQKFTSYVYDPVYAKPYLGPVYLSNGSSITRLDLETKEHPHQRSIFVAVGDINGVDYWNEPPGHGIQRHQGFSDIIRRGAYASFTARNVWETSDGKPAADEERTFTFYNQPHECRYIDLEIKFRASYGDITFGATKEAGPLGIRVAESIRADKGGFMVNAYGAEDESECWGRSAQWCVYGGTVDGLECGISVFDNEENERYPTSWHIRNYGLFAANNLYFKGGLVIKAGDSLTYKYRICVFEGKQNIAEKFINYIK